MGLFDRFRKPRKAEEVVSTPPNVQSTPPSELHFQNVGHFEITSCPGAHALELWTKLRQEGQAAGFTALILGSARDVELLAENREYKPQSPEDILRVAAKVDTDDWLKKHIESDPEAFQAEFGEWPSKAPEPGSVSAHLEVLSRKPLPWVYLAKIPKSRNWEAPAYIGMGGWNACPDAAEITAFAKRWHERYGAEVASITHDVMEFVVTKPPKSWDEAAALAKEQYIFCPDIVDQGCDNVANLAASLLKSNYWYFWWD